MKEELDRLAPPAACLNQRLVEEDMKESVVPIDYDQEDEDVDVEGLGEDKPSTLYTYGDKLKKTKNEEEKKSAVATGMAIEKALIKLATNQ